LGYFMTRTHQFLVKCGVAKEKIRFRQHLRTEMAHYAADCWDAEIFTTYGWIECAGHADRSAYDLRVHSIKSKCDLQAQDQLPEPRMVEQVYVNPNRAVLGKAFRKESKALIEYFEKLSKIDVLRIKQQLQDDGHVELDVNGAKFKLDTTMINVVEEEVKESVEKYIPNVIEPSFGLGRIIYSLLEQSFRYRDLHDKKRTYLKLPPAIAPIKVGIFPLSTNDAFTPFVDTLSTAFVGVNISTKPDSSGVAIGRKYARADELGVPFGITIDFQTVQDQTVTLRERDSMCQVRLAMDAAVMVVMNLITGLTTWEKVYAKHPQVVRPDAEEEGEDQAKVAA